MGKYPATHFNAAVLCSLIVSVLVKNLEWSIFERSRSKYVTVTKVSFWEDAGSTRTGTYTPPQIKLLKVVVMQKCSLQWNWIILKETVIRKFFLHQQLLSTWSKCWELELIPTNQLWFHYFTLPQVQRRNIWTTNWIILSLWNLPFSEQSKSLPGIPVSNQQSPVPVVLASS